MSLATEIKSILDKAVATPNGPAGLVYGAVDATGAMLVCEAAGHRELGSNEPMKTDAFFTLFSLTKLLTTIAVLHLVDQDGLALDDPIHTVLPEILDVGVLTPSDGPAQPEGITLRMLLTHTAGFGYTLFHPPLAAHWRVGGGPDELSGLREGVLGFPLAHKPGTRWMYGTGIDWAGEAVARASGLSLGDYLKQNVFAPLGIEDEITFHLSPERAARLAGMHTRGTDGLLRVTDHPPFVRDAPFESGGGCALGTLRGYLSVLGVLLNGGVGANGARILKDETVASMFVNQVPEGVPGVPTGWGLSFELNLGALPTCRSANSGAWAGLANLYYSVDPTKGVATLIMSQSLPFFDPGVTAPFLEAEETVYASLS